MSRKSWNQFANFLTAFVLGLTCGAMMAMYAHWLENH